VFDVIVNGTAEGWVDDGSFPVSAKVALNDVHGRVHHIVEKEPVLASVPLALDPDGSGGCVAGGSSGGATTFQLDRLAGRIGP
jgi:hypothetical protein